MTDITTSTDLNANVETEHADLGANAGGSAAAHADEGGGHLMGGGDAGVTYSSEHASGSVDAGGALDAVANAEGADVSGGAEGAVSYATDAAGDTVDFGGAIDGTDVSAHVEDVSTGELEGAVHGAIDGIDVPGPADVPDVDAGFSLSAAFDAMFDAMGDLVVQISGSLSAMIGL